MSRNSKNPLESPFGKGGQAIREVQQDAAVFGGAPEGEHETRPYKGYPGMCRGERPFAEGLWVSRARTTSPYRPTPSRCSRMLPGFGVSPKSLFFFVPPRLGDQGG